MSRWHVDGKGRRAPQAGRRRRGQPERADVLWRGGPGAWGTDWKLLTPERRFLPKQGEAHAPSSLGEEQHPRDKDWGLSLWASCFSPLGPGHQAQSFPHDTPRRSIIPLRQRGETEVTRPQPCSPSVGSAARTCDRGRVSPWPPRAARPSREHERGVAPGCPAVPGRPLKQSLS